MNLINVVLKDTTDLLNINIRLMSIAILIVATESSFLNNANIIKILLPFFHDSATAR